MDRISIIIPSLNEASSIRSALESTRGAENAEVIVVDGGSADGTPEIARSLDARVIRTPPGRALQQNRGAQAAEGAILLFLHADSLLPEGFEGYVREIMGRPGTAGGCFSFKLDRASRSLSVIEWGVNLRSRRFQLPYGDQALFMRRGLFNELGGFREMPILEDLELVRRLRRRGRIVTAGAPVITSGRRWGEMAPWRVMFLNQVLLLAYYSGVSPDTIARWYRRRK